MVAFLSFISWTVTETGRKRDERCQQNRGIKKRYLQATILCTQTSYQCAKNLNTENTPRLSFQRTFHQCNNNRLTV